MNASESGTGGPRKPPTPRLTERFDAALRMASEMHRSQLRKGTETPYVSHLLGTCAIALEYGADEDQAIAALLHDAAEDQGGTPTLDRIRHLFGDRVADIVKGCTDDVDRAELASSAERAADSARRKQRYVAGLAQEPAETRLVSAADKLHNARCILADYREVGDEVWKRFKVGKDGTLAYYRSLVTAFEEAGDGPIVRELNRVVTQMKRAARAKDSR